MNEIEEEAQSEGDDEGVVDFKAEENENRCGDERVQWDGSDAVRERFGDCASIRTQNHSRTAFEEHEHPR